MYPVKWNTNESNGESHASLESFETNFNQVQNNNNNNNNNNKKFIQYYHFVQVLPIKITIINS